MTRMDDDQSKVTLSRTGLEAGGGEERSEVVKGSEMKLTGRTAVFQSPAMCQIFAGLCNWSCCRFLRQVLH